MKKYPKKNRSHFLLLAVIFLFSMMIPQNVAAQKEQADHVIVLFILDDSGSMSGNDPSNLRYTAAQLFIASMDESDTVGAIRFSSMSEQITQGLVPLSGGKEKAEIIDSIIPVKAEGYTDVKAAFLEAETLLKSKSDTSDNTIVILLTDGKPEIPQPYAGYEEETLAIAKRLGVPVYAIALTYAGQSAFLNQVASQTEGKVISAKNANDLLDSYLQILGELKDRTVIGEDIDRSPGDIILELDPALMPYVSKATFIVSHDPAVKVRLIGPDQKEVQSSDPMVSFSMTSDPGFTAYTITNPASGEWNFNLSGNGSAQIRAILHSRLRIKIVSPTNLVETGRPMGIVVNLIEEQEDGSLVKIVGDASFSAMVTLPDGSQQSLDTFYDDGTHGDQIAGDGNFTRDFVDTIQPGSYEISVRGLKGVVPVSAAIRVEAIPFPKIVIDQPTDQTYEIRSNTVPLKIYLEGENTSTAFEGSITALVTSPDGKTTKIMLSPGEDSFTGQFSPTESGTHTVMFQSEDSFFQGLSYQKEAGTRFETVLFAQMHILSVEPGLGASELNKFEIQEAIQGIPLLVTINSTATGSEQVVPRVEKLPGFSLVEAIPVEIAPAGETTITLYLVGDKQLKPGNWEGLLTLEPLGPVDVVNNRFPFDFEIYTPVITFSTEVISQCAEKACWKWNPVTIILDMNSTSLVSENLDIRLEGLAGSSFSMNSIEIQPGTSQVELEIQPTEPFAPGDYSGTISLLNPRDGVEILPDQTIPFTFSVDPLWVSCRKPLIFLGIGFFLVGMIFVRIIRKMIKAAKPPLVTGTLVHWSQGTPELTTSVDLTALKKAEIRVGRGINNDVVIPDDLMEETHAMITAEIVEDEIRFILQPYAKVRKGYREYTDPLPLEENTSYQMGSQIFTYICDINL